MRAPSVIKGLLSYVPGLYGVLDRRGGGRGTLSSRYCYGVWLKHLTLLRAHSGIERVPRSIAELGPGASLGVGLAGLLCGAEEYVGLDVEPLSEAQRNAQVLDDLVALFEARASRPEKGWPDFDEYLDERLFPASILTESALNANLAPERVHAIKSSLRTLEGPVSYVAPWSGEVTIRESSVDLVISHSVLEHVTDLPATYRALYRWLKPGALMSHQIDFGSHGMTALWNGHRACSELVWRITHGKRPYLINREPISKHIELIEAAGFDVVTVLTRHRYDGIKRERLGARWKGITEEDLSCCEAYVQARKPTA